MAFQPSITQTIKTLFHNNRFVIPDYQRKYSWIYDQRNALWEDIGENLEMKHFIGTLCFQKIEDTDEIINEVYEVIDGQQRITTLYILLNTLIIQLEDIDKRTAYSTLYIGSEKSPKLIPLGTDEAFMKRLIFDYTNIDADTIKSRSQKNLYQAKREFLSKSKNFTQAQFLKWITYISKQIEILIFNVKDQSQAVKMFTVINDRGLPLSNLDKSKSVLMLYSTLYLNGELNDLVNEKFARIFDYLDNVLEQKKILNLFRRLEDKEFENTFYTHHYYSSRRLFPDWDYRLGADSIFTQLKRNCENLKLDLPKLKNFITDYVKDFANFAKAYSDLFDAIATDDTFGKFFRYLEFTATLYPFIVRLKEQDKLASLLPILEIVEFRVYKLKNTNPRRWMYEMSSIVMEKEITEVRLKAALQEFAERFLGDYQLKDYLGATVDKKTALVKYLMYEFNRINYKQDLDLSYYRILQVEHIFSVNPNFGLKKYGWEKREIYDKDISRVGNLTILEKKLNAKVSSISPIDKSKGYQQSKIQVNSDILGELSNFNRIYIEGRTEELIAFALKRFAIYQ